MPVAQHIMNICARRPLQRLSLGMNEDLLQHVPQYLHILAKTRPEKVTTLGLASVKDDPASYYILSYDGILLMPFSNLQILSTDYDALSDTFLHSLRAAQNLERLVIHVHGIWEEHCGTTEEAWRDFTEIHPNCGVRVSLIHAYDEVIDPNPPFLKRNMRLTHFRALFCENINIRLLDLLSRYYEKTLRSFMWIDSLNNQRIAWNLSASLRRNLYPDGPDPDPLIILAWLCSELEEITFMGYKYAEEDLVAIARLRTDTLKKLEIANVDILYSRSRSVNARKEISKILGKPWQPVPNSQLHPVILDPVEGDSDEFISPYLLSDLR
nr:F-box only protein 33-like [Onthophagus taurus]